LHRTWSLIRRIRRKICKPTKAPQFVEELRASVGYLSPHTQMRHHLEAGRIEVKRYTLLHPRMGALTPPEHDSPTFLVYVKET